MAVTVPHQPGMHLGRTFDLQKLRAGLDIFTDDAVAKSKTTDTSQTSIRYAVVKEAKDINHILDVGGEISLKCKAGIFKVEGMGSYLREDRTKDNTLEILARAHVETMTVSMTDSNPKPGWTENVVGTHYIRSITYGGDLIVRIRIEGSDARHFQDIKAKVEGGLHLQGGMVDAGAKASFRKMEEDLKSSSKIDISYYSTTLQGMMPRDIDGMLRALDSFKDQVLKLNEGKGVPLICELQPLSVLDSKLTNVLRDKTLDVQLKSLEDNYDDVLEARARLKRLMERHDVDLDDDQETKACEMEEKIDNLVAIFNRVISNLDVTSEGDGPEQMEPAFKSYKQNRKAGGFNREVARFVKSVLPPPKDDAPKTPVEDLPSGKQLDLILIGKTGHGKSATGNTIFGEEKERFHSRMSASSVTNQCQKEFAEIGKREICLVDTPGTMDTKDPYGTIKEMATAIASMPDGYHAFLIVLSVNTRMTPEEQMAIKMLKRLFGESILMKYAILVFTYGDLFYKEQKKRGNITFKEFIKSQDGELAKLLRESSERYVLFNNSESDAGEKRQQVIQLVTVIDKLQIDLGGVKYTNDLFDKAKKMLKEEEEKEREEEKDKQDKDLEDKLSAAREEGRKEGIKEREEKVGSKLGEQVVEEGRGCFLGDAEVKLENGKAVKMKELQVGDKVLSTVLNDSLTFSEVYFFGHRDEHGISKYINITTVSTELKMTPDHHVYLISDGRTYTVSSEQIRKGDHIFILDSQSNSLKEEVVTDLSTSIEVGVYSPLTMSGTIIVNDMFVSCYGDYVSPRLSHTLLWPVRQLHRLCPSLSAWINTPGRNGMPSWVRWCMDNVILPYRK